MKHSSNTTLLAMFLTRTLFVFSLFVALDARAVPPRCLLISEAAGQVSPRLVKFIGRQGVWERFLEGDGVLNRVGTVIAHAPEGAKEWVISDGHLDVQFVTEVGEDSISVRFTYFKPKGTAIGTRPRDNLLFARAMVGVLDGLAERAEYRLGDPLDVKIQTGAVLNETARETLESLGMRGRWNPSAVAGAAFLLATRQITLEQFTERFGQTLRARSYELSFTLHASP